MNNELENHLRAYQGNIIYDFDNLIQLNWYPERVMKYSKKTNSLLELGLGHGITTDKFSKYFHKHIVLDGSPSVIEQFKEKYPGCPAKIIETYFEKFESNNQFDLIVMGYP